MSLVNNCAGYFMPERVASGKNERENLLLCEGKVNLRGRVND